MTRALIPTLAILACLQWIPWAPLTSWPTSPSPPPQHWYKPPCNLLTQLPEDGCTRTADIAPPSGIPAPCIAYAFTHPPDPLDAEEIANVLVIYVDHPEMNTVETVVLTQDHAGRWIIWPDWWNSDCGINETPLAYATAEALNRHSLEPFFGYTTPLPPEFISLILSLSGSEHRIYLPLIARTWNPGLSVADAAGPRASRPRSPVLPKWLPGR